MGGGGGGGWTDPIDWRGAGDALASIDPGPAIGKAGEAIDKAVNDVIPGGWAMVGAIALTVISMGTIDLEPEVLAAAEGAEAAGTVGGGGTAAAGTAGDVFAGYSAAGSAAGTAGTVAYTAPTALQAALSAAGTGALYGGTIGGVSSAVRGQDPLKGALYGAAMGAVTGGVANGLTSAGMNPYAANALINITKGVASGQNLSSILQNTAISSGLGAMASTANNALVNEGANPTLAQYLTSIGAGAAGSAIKGGDIGLGALTGAVAPTMKSLLDFTKTTTDLVNSSQKYYNDTLNPAYKAAQSDYDAAQSANSAYTSAYNDYKAKYDEYKTLDDKYNELVKTDPTAAGAMASQLRTYEADLKTMGDNLKPLEQAAVSAGNTYNTTYKSYQDLASKYSGQVQQIKDTSTQLENQTAAFAKNLQDSVTQVQNLPAAARQGFFSQLDASNGDPTAALKLANNVSQLSTPQQEYFSFANRSGISATDALTYAPDLSKMSTTALQTFFDQTNNSGVPPADALKVANEINSLAQNQQATFANATANGLSYDQAKYLASNASNLGSNAQNMLISSMKNGTDSTIAQIFAATQQLVDPGAAVSNLNASAQAQLKTPEQITAYNELMATGQFKPTDALKAVLDVVVPSAQAADTTQPATNQQTSPGIYHQDESGKWGVYVKDPTSGQLVNTGAVLSSSGADFATSKYVEGAPSGDLFPISKDENGVPNLSMIPVQKPTDTSQAAGQTQTTKEQLDKELAENQITQAEYEAALKNVATTSPVPGSTTNAPSSDPYQQMIDNAITKAAQAAANAYANKGTSPTGGTSTGGTNVIGGIGGPGTGTGGTGAGGTGTGGTGAGGTGTGTGTGGGYNALNFGSKSPSSQYGGITNLVGTFGPSQEATLVGLPSGQNMTNPNPMTYNPYGIGGFASGGSISNLASDGISAVGGSSSDIQALSPTLRQVHKAQLLGIPTIQETMNPLTSSPFIQTPLQSLQSQAPVVHLAEGGLPEPTYEYTRSGFPRMSPLIMKGRSTGLYGLPKREAIGDLSGKLMGLAEGGSAEGEEEHIPSFYSEGGLNSMENTYVQGEGDGTSDSVKAMLADGEFVIPADVVSNLGNGSNKAGAKVLDELLAVIREHKQNHDPKDLPPKSKGPLAYLLDANRKVRA